MASATDRQLLEEIYGGICNQQDKAKLDTDPELALIESLTIPVPDNRSYPVTEKGYRAAQEFVGSCWKSGRFPHAKVEKATFELFCLLALGQMFYEQRENQQLQHGDDGLDHLLSEHARILDEQLAAMPHDVTQHIPVVLFRGEHGVDTFHIGPVTFRCVPDWLVEFVNDDETRKHVVGMSARDVSDLPLDAPQKKHDAARYWRFLRGYDWVASVTFDQHDPKRAATKARTVVSLALDVIGLCFHPSNAANLVMAGRNHLQPVRDLSTLSDGKKLWSSTSPRPGIGAAPNQIRDDLKDEGSFLKAAGQLLAEYVEGRAKDTANPLVEHWVNALNWAGSARRQLTDSQAVVAYGAALDVMSGVKSKDRFIKEFLHAALDGVPEPTIETIIKKVYGEGRSALLHGGAYELLEDFEHERTLGDRAVTAMLLAVTPVIADLIHAGTVARSSDRKAAFKELINALSHRAIAPVPHST